MENYVSSEYKSLMEKAKPIQIYLYRCKSQLKLERSVFLKNFRN